MIRCIYRYQKWIPDKIPHRNDNSIFLSTHFFSTKIFILKIEKYFPENFQKSFRKKYFSFIKFSEGKIFFAKGFLKILKKIFSYFQNENFCRTKKLRKKIELLFRCRIVSGIHFWQLEIHRSTADSSKPYPSFFFVNFSKPRWSLNIITCTKENYSHYILTFLFQTLRVIFVLSSLMHSTYPHWILFIDK